MKTCPECGHAVKDAHAKCMKCGAAVPEAPVEAPPPEAANTPVARAKERLAPLKELLPTRKAVDQLLPHPTGWILGIAVPAIVALMVIHGLAFPGSATAKEDAASGEATRKAQQTRFQRCLKQARAKADLECGTITGTAEGMRRMTCTAARLSADYTTCTVRLTGRLGRCLGRCGQAARSCSSACALTGKPDQGWTDTAKCLLPCWAERLTGCSSSCFRTGGEEPAPQDTASSI